MNPSNIPWWGWCVLFGAIVNVIVAEVAKRRARRALAEFESSTERRSS